MPRKIETAPEPAADAAEFAEALSFPEAAPHVAAPTQAETAALVPTPEAQAVIHEWVVSALYGSPVERAPGLLEYLEAAAGALSCCELDDQAVALWRESWLHNSPVSQDTEIFNHVTAALPGLVAGLRGLKE